MVNFKDDLKQVLEKVTMHKCNSIQTKSGNIHPVLCRAGCVNTAVMGDVCVYVSICVVGESMRM